MTVNAASFSLVARACGFGAPKASTKSAPTTPKNQVAQNWESRRRAGRSGGGVGAGGVGTGQAKKACFSQAEKIGPGRTQAATLDRCEERTPQPVGLLFPSPRLLERLSSRQNAPEWGTVERIWAKASRSARAADHKEANAYACDDFWHVDNLA
jgi:hypothetical protein